MPFLADLLAEASVLRQASGAPLSAQTAAKRADVTMADAPDAAVTHSDDTLAGLAPMSSVSSTTSSPPAQPNPLDQSPEEQLWLRRAISRHGTTRYINRPVGHNGLPFHNSNLGAPYRPNGANHNHTIYLYGAVHLRNITLTYQWDLDDARFVGFNDELNGDTFDFRDPAISRRLTRYEQHRQAGSNSEGALAIEAYFWAACFERLYFPSRFVARDEYLKCEVAVRRAANRWGFVDWRALVEEVAREVRGVVEDFPGFMARQGTITPMTDAFLAVEFGRMGVDEEAPVYDPDRQMEVLGDVMGEWKI
ncbi:hypothetical protein LTS18_007128 [Coniosporium uncinatum]|uniref:Uncharacterized protein n=1 Tax=Coniosporium uncinatum TaxID=93489 RepID=A0ACC3D398_9PEZI|nr:hypothetical protein LTS18_007128 [Coniosporium uncinatum]